MIYDVNVNKLNIQANTNSINEINNTTIPNLDSKYLIKNDVNITESVLGKFKCDNIDSINSTLKIGENASNIYLGSSDNTDVKNIFIGGVNDVVNIQGSLNSI